MEDTLFKFFLSQESSSPQSTDKTLFEILSSSPTTSAFISALQNHPSLMTLLNDTNSNLTILAPSNLAFEKFQTTNEDLSAILHYHILPEPLSLSRIIAITTSTLPILLHPPLLNGPERINLLHDERGLLMNNSSRVKAFDIHAKKGFNKALEITGVGEEMEGEWVGCMVFSPTDKAFEKLGEEVNECLFSEEKEGRECLRALLAGHVVRGRTLYSNAFYDVPELSHKERTTEAEVTIQRRNQLSRQGQEDSCPPSLLEDGEYALDAEIFRYSRLIAMGINKHAVQFPVEDFLAENRVVHPLDSVLVPGGPTVGEGKGRKMDIEEVKLRLDKYI
ncbi:uncharacterized protein PAC_11317 [Phialocephala subalpina]|uniref:FAS1 domain-containing protein n=1 Tax=Phialocephala subalpina TaxID=576137 RepID=A0A1L7X8S5_9HELO|nr:uncharacterized protein PAC_11317 [Phialocephala subalpina]